MEDLLASPRQRVTAPPEKKPETLERPKKRLKLIAYIGVGIAAFGFFFVLKLPQELLLGNLLGYLSSSTPFYFQADEAALKPLLRPHLSFSNLKITPRFGDSSNVITVQSMNITPNIFGSLPWKGSLNPSTDFSFDSFGGSGSGHISMGSQTDILFDGENLQMEKLPLLKSMGLDLRGILSALHLAITMNQGRASLANGDVRIMAKNLLFDPAPLQLPLPFPPLSFGNLVLQGRINAGKLQIERFTLGGPTQDLEMTADGSINLSDRYEFSQLDLKLKFKIAEKILKSVSGLEGMLPIVAAKGADGYYGMKLTGALMAPNMPQPLAP